MFVDYIVDAISGDSSINDLVTGGIRYEHLPEDFNSSLDWIVFGFTGNEETRTLDGNGIIMKYGLQVQVISQTMTNVLTLGDMVKTYLTGYDDGANIRDIAFVDDDVAFDLEKKVYYVTSNYDVLFIN